MDAMLCTVSSEHSNMHRHQKRSRQISMRATAFDATRPTGPFVCICSVNLSTIQSDFSKEHATFSLLCSKYKEQVRCRFLGIFLLDVLFSYICGRFP